jgi:hypothetical protein
VSVEVTTPASAPPNVREVLIQLASQVGENPSVELVALDAAGARYRIGVNSTLPDAKGQLLLLATDALSKSKVSLGPPPPPRRTALP